jgi:hypothetical protein
MFGEGKMKGKRERVEQEAARKEERRKERKRIKKPQAIAIETQTNKEERKHDLSMEKEGKHKLGEGKFGNGKFRPPLSSEADCSDVQAFGEVNEREGASSLEVPFTRRLEICILQFQEIFSQTFLFQDFFQALVFFWPDPFWRRSQGTFTRNQIQIQQEYSVLHSQWLLAGCRCSRSRESHQVYTCGGNKRLSFLLFYSLLPLLSLSVCLCAGV